MLYHDGLHPTFAKVINIMVIADFVVLEVILSIVQYFDDHYHAYVIENSAEKSYINYAELSDHSVLHAHTKNETIIYYMYT